MIEWKEYGQTRETQPPSHEPRLITNGKFVVIGVHQIGRDRVYRWYTNKGQPIAGVTHYAEINLPQALDSTAPAQADKGGLNHCPHSNSA